MPTATMTDGQNRCTRCRTNSPALAGWPRGRRRQATSPRLEDFSDDVVLELLSLYRGLGGIEDHPRLRPGTWDLSFGGVLVELDEELHFNRYRRRTIEAALWSSTPWASFYMDASVHHEPDCLRAGRAGARWTNPSAAETLGGGLSLETSTPHEVLHVGSSVRCTTR